MRTFRPVSLLTAAIVLVMPVAALAHENRVYSINGKEYLIEVGFLHEPVLVDDKSGVELTVKNLGVPPPPEAMVMADGDQPVGTPAVGLENTLKVEVIAGDQKKILDIKPLAGEPGAYQSVFYPAAETTYTFRLFGTINDTLFDVNFSCNPATGEEGPEDKTPVKITDTLTQVSKEGAFGCPKSRADMLFPSSASAAALADDVPAEAAGGGMNVLGIIGTVSGLLGLLLGGVAIKIVLSAQAQEEPPVQ